MLDISVTMTANHRPEYFEKVLASWARVHGVYSSMMSCQFEPVVNSNETSINLYRQYFPMGGYGINLEKMGPLGNPFMALDEAFNSGADFVILGEDDSIVSPDVFNYFAWAASEYQYDPKVFAVCSFTHHYPNPKPNQVFRQNWFASVVWGTWRDQWLDWIRPNWGWHYSDDEWDLRFVQHVNQEDLVCIYPEYSRSQHIGVNGAHMSESQFRALQADRIYDGTLINYFKEAPCRL